jgi:hypothetical protein
MVVGKALLADQSLATPVRESRPSCVASVLARLEEVTSRSAAFAGRETHNTKAVQRGSNCRSLFITPLKSNYWSAA